MSQTSNGVGGAYNLDVANNLTSGTLSLSYSPARSGIIFIGHPSSTGNIEIDAGSSAVITRGTGSLQADDGISFDSGSNIMSTYTTSNSFTPILTPDASGSYTHDLQVGRYTQIGERIFFDLALRWNGSVSPSGIVTITTGLPLLANIPDYYVALSVGGMDGLKGAGTDAQFAATMVFNTNVIRLSFEDLQTASAGPVFLTDGEIDPNEGFMIMSGSYIVA